MQVIFENESDFSVTKEEFDVLEKAILKTLELEDFGSNCAVSLLLVNEDTMKDINFSSRNKNEVTDVLSFPQYDEDYVFFSNEDEDVWLGDIVLCVKRAREQAVSFGHTLIDEMVYLVIHSTLHLLGYDHIEPNEKIDMRKREKDVLFSLVQDNIIDCEIN